LFEAQLKNKNRAVKSAVKISLFFMKLLYPSHSVFALH